MENGLSFRPLEADEIEVRVAQAKDNGVSLLLYKDARCDMRMLDDVVGAENWECDYSEIHNALYCTVKIFDEDRGIWVSEQDCGVPSNMEGTKGESSDAFKRACFRWGVGRELYTAPFIWVTNKNCKIGKNKNGNPACYDRFSVKSIETVDGRIRGLTIWNDSLNRVAWSNKNNDSNREKTASNDESNVVAVAEFVEVASEEQIGVYVEMVHEFADMCHKEWDDAHNAVASSTIMQEAGNDYNAWTPEQMQNAINQLNVWIEKTKEAQAVNDELLQEEELASEDIKF